MAKAITMIPATKNQYTSVPTDTVEKRRVAAYARVSTDTDEQFTSYEAQIDYYTHYIKKRPDWEFVKVYTDEGISGTNTKHRDGFNEMVADALAGKIDLIITKSVSRFARNTVDSLVTVRKLKEHHVEVFFEKENIYTFDGKGELLITIMSSLAQEESRSISENVTWGQRKRFADGKFSLAYSTFLGYDKGDGGQLIINEEEAKIVRMIYRMFLNGHTARSICGHLEKLGILAPRGGTKWSKTTVMSILQNEKYKGDALLQKTYTADFLTKKIKYNHGEIPQYYVENSHEAIISSVEFDMVQSEIARRRAMGNSYSMGGMFACKIICGDCGAFYGPQVWHSNDAYRKDIWRCNKKYRGAVKCETASLEPEKIKQMFLEAYNRLMGRREQMLEDCEEIRSLLGDTSEIDEKIRGIKEEIEIVVEMVNKHVKENATKQLKQDTYIEKYNSLVKRYESLNKKLEKLKAERVKKAKKDRDIAIFIESLKEKPLVIDEWDSELWLTLLENATVNGKESVVFMFKNGVSIEVNI